jgi:hypothetical protein
MTAWTDAVSAEFKEGRKTNPNFSLKQAMMKAKKTYKKGKTAKKRGGAVIPLSPGSVENHKAPVAPVMKGGKKNKSIKKNKSSKKGKK